MGQMCLRGLANSYAKLRLPGGFQFDWLVLCTFPTCSEGQRMGLLFLSAGLPHGAILFIFPVGLEMTHASAWWLQKGQTFWLPR